MKPISFAVGINDLPKEISGFGNLNLEKLFKTGLHVHCNSDEIPNATACKMIDSHVECYEECGKSKYVCDCEVERFVHLFIFYLFWSLHFNFLSKILSKKPSKK